MTLRVNSEKQLEELKRYQAAIAVQVHVGPPMTIAYKNFRIKTFN